MSKIFLLTIECSLSYIEGANLFVGGIHAMNAIISASRAKGNLALLIHFRRNASQHRALGAEEVEIVASQADLRSRLSASRLQGSVSGENADQVAAKSAEGDHQCVLKSGAISQQQDYRGDSPCHAQHRENGTATIVF